jgi:hypothetical protein
MVYIWAWHGPAARLVDLLQDDRALGDAESAAAVLGRDQRGEDPRLGQGTNEGLGVGAVEVAASPVLAAEARAQLAHLGAERVMPVLVALGHGDIVPRS